MSSLRHLIACLLLCLSVGSALAQTCAAPGKDGPAVIPSGVLNTYYPATASAAAGATTISLGAATGSATPLAPGDQVLIIQMQDGVNAANFNTTTVATYGSAFGTAGQYEYGLVRSFAGGVLTLVNALSNSYARAVTAGSPKQTFQIVRVPQYSVASIPAANTVTAALWNGAAGGIVAMDVSSQLTLSGVVDVSGSGFRGGGGQILNGGGTPLASRFVTAYTTNTLLGSMKGEGTAGTPCGTFDRVNTFIYSCDRNAGADLYPNGDNGYGAPGNAGGGGNDGDLAGNSENSGGGGGGNAGAGGQGGNTWSSNVNVGGRGGQPFSPSVSKLVMGGGGGAGVTNNGTAGADNTYSGAPGGGLVIIRTGALAGSGSIKANGLDAQLPNAACCDDGGNGAGAGGTVLVLAQTSAGLANITVSASGGRGSNTPNANNNQPNHGPGGGGGGGAVLSNGGFAGVNLNGGLPGYTNTAPNTNTYSATPGGIGSANTALSFTGTPGVQPGASCLPQLTIAKSTTTPLRIVPASTTAQYVLTISNAASASGAAYGVAITDILPLPFGLATTNTAATTTIGGTGTTGPSPTVANSSGITTTVQFGTPGSTTRTFTLFPGGQVTATFNVNLNTTTYATYQNSASVTFTDPTRSSGASATAAGIANPVVSPGGAYTSGATVGGSNYSSASSTAEDVKLIAGTTTLTISKTNGTTTVVAGSATTYTITVANLGPTDASGTVLRDPAVPGLACTTITCAVSGSASCPAPLTISALQSSGVTITPTFNAGSTVTFSLTCGVTATGQ